MPRVTRKLESEDGPRSGKKLSEAEKSAVLEFIKMAWSDLEFFARNVVGGLLTFEVPEFHRELYKILPRINRAVIAAPRGFAKSTISTVIYPLWLAISQVSYKNIMIISASESFAVNLLRKIKVEIETNETILKYFGDLRTDKWSENHIIVKGGVQILAKGAEGQVRGFRPDCVILDDIETDEGVLSEEQRKKLKDWLFKSCLNTLLPGGQFLLVGTILSQQSLLSELLTTDNGWFKKKYMAYKDGIEKEGNELWPSLWPHSALQQRKAEIGSFAFSSEYMNNPIDDGAMPIKEDQISYWSSIPDNLNYYIALDPAYSEDESSDYKVAALVGVDGQMNRYLISYIRTHESMSVFMQKVLTLWKIHSHEVVGLGVPCTGTEREFYRSFEEFCHRQGYFPPLQELKNIFRDQTNVSHRNKQRRIIASLQPLFEVKKYFIGRDHSEAKDELLAIGSSKHDDVVDAMAYVEQMVMNLGEAETIQIERNEEIQEESISDYGYAS